MRAAMQHRYGPPGVLTVGEVDPPTAGPGQILIRVHASPVTQGDRRIRAGDFPGVTWLPGRLMMGITGPRAKLAGSMFAGRVVAVGPGVTRFAVDDDVFGATTHGAHAELLSIRETGAVARMPGGLGYDEAAALPYGAVTSLVFLRDLASVQPAEHVCIVGASGGVGLLAVQVAKHLGARVTGVCSGDSHDLVRSLGADHLVDYRAADFRQSGPYDVILDTLGASRFDLSRESLNQGGRYLGLNATARLLWHALTSRFGHKRALTGVAVDSRQHTEEVRELAASGAVRPVIDRAFPLDRIAEAHAYVESGHNRGCVIVTVADAAAVQ